MSTETEVAAALERVAARHPVPSGLWGQIAAALDEGSMPARRRRYSLLFIAVVASVALAAAGIAAVTASRDRADNGAPPTSIAPRSAVGSRRELPPTFVALRHDGRLAVVDTATLREVSTIVTDCGDCSRVRVSPDQTLVRFQRGGALFEAPLGGGTSRALASGCLAAVSPFAPLIAVADCESGAISIEGTSGNGGAGPGWPSGPNPVVDLTWGPSGDTVLVSAGFDPVALYRYSLDRPGVEPERLGPPDQSQPAGTGWISPDVGDDGVIAVAEVCCTLPAGSYAADSTVVYLAPGDGHQLVRNPIKASLVSLDFDASGRFLLLVGADGDLFAEWEGKRLRLGGGFLDVSW